MNEIATLAAVVGLSTGLLTLLGGLWKVFSLIASLQRKDDALEHKIDAQELFTNGLKAQLDHKVSRLTNQLSSQGAILRDCEAYLIKHTEYESRSRDSDRRHTTTMD